VIDFFLFIVMLGVFFDGFMFFPVCSCFLSVWLLGVVLFFFDSVFCVMGDFSCLGCSSCFLFVGFLGDVRCFGCCLVFLGVFFLFLCFVVVLLLLFFVGGLVCVCGSFRFGVCCVWCFWCVVFEVVGGLLYVVLLFGLFFFFLTFFLCFGLVFFLCFWVFDLFVLCCLGWWVGGLLVGVFCWGCWLVGLLVVCD